MYLLVIIYRRKFALVFVMRNGYTLIIVLKKGHTVELRYDAVRLTADPDIPRGGGLAPDFSDF